VAKPTFGVTLLLTRFFTNSLKKAVAIMFQGAENVGAWMWEKYGPKVVERILRTVGNKIEPQVQAKWQRMRWSTAEKKYRARVTELCGTTRVLGKPEPIKLDNIFTEVCILDLPTAYRRFDITDLEKDPSQLKLQDSTKRVGGSVWFGIVEKPNFSFSVNQVLAKPRF
jgi:hypothetical protein